LLIADAPLRSGYVLRGQRYAAQSHSMQNVQKLIQLIDAGPGELDSPDRRPEAPLNSRS
jgi:hypothetical protein